MYHLLFIFTVKDFFVEPVFNSGENLVAHPCVEIAEYDNFIMFRYCVEYALEVVVEFSSFCLCLVDIGGINTYLQFIIWIAVVFWNSNVTCNILPLLYAISTVIHKFFGQLLISLFPVFLFHCILAHSLRSWCFLCPSFCFR